MQRKYTVVHCTICPKRRLPNPTMLCSLAVLELTKNFLETPIDSKRIYVDQGSYWSQSACPNDVFSLLKWLIITSTLVLGHFWVN